MLVHSENGAMCQACVRGRRRWVASGGEEDVEYLQVAEMFG